MAQLFNRRMQFKVLSIKENSPIQAIITWEKQKIEANFQKGSRNTTPNTGRITVTNPNRREISLLVDAVNPLFLKFALLAGYGEDLHLVSEGHINEVNFRHSGGDINIDFTVSEANPVLKDPWASISKMNFPEGTSLIQIISNMEELGVPVEIVDPDGTNLKELQTLKIEDDIQIHEDPVQNLTDLIKQYGYSITILNEKMLIHKNIEINPRQINYKEDSLAVLNFQTGLLSASLENTYNYEDDIKTPWLSFGMFMDSKRSSYCCYCSK